MSMKNSNETIWNRTSDLPICMCYRGPCCDIYFHLLVIIKINPANSLTRQHPEAVKQPYTDWRRTSYRTYNAYWLLRDILKTINSFLRGRVKWKP